MKTSHPTMPFWEHLEELRWRLIKAIVTIIIGALITYKFADPIMHWLILPAKSLSIDLNLQVRKITSMFTVKLSVALFGGIILGLPVILYQFWRFVSPAFEDKHGFAMLLAVLFSSVFSEERISDEPNRIIKHPSSDQSFSNLFSGITPT